jgi:hypothetical protein
LIFSGSEATCKLLCTVEKMAFSMKPLQLRFNGQQAHETDAEPSPETSVGVNRKHFLFSIDHSVPPNSIGSIGILDQLQPEGRLLGEGVENGGHIRADLS